MTEPDVAAETPVALDSLTAVIPNWGTAELSIRCAHALKADGLGADRIVVVENGSEDDSYERLREALPDCRVLRIDVNIGYAAAANRGAAELEGDAYLLINNDAFVHAPGSLQTMLRALGRSDVGIVAPLLRNEDGTVQRSVRPLDDAASTLVRAVGISRVVPNRWQPRLGTHWDHSVSRAIRAADGPVLLVRGDLWHNVNGFAEGRVMHGEDTDLCWRARGRGWKVWFERDAEFVHLGNVSAGRHYASPQRGTQIGEAEGAMLREHLPPLSAALAVCFTAVGLAGRAAVLAAVGRRERAKVLLATMRGYRSGYGRAAGRDREPPASSSTAP